MAHIKGLDEGLLTNKIIVIVFRWHVAEEVASVMSIFHRVTQEEFFVQAPCPVLFVSWSFSESCRGPDGYAGEFDYLNASPLRELIERAPHELLRVAWQGDESRSGVEEFHRRVAYWAFAQRMYRGRVTHPHSCKQGKNKCVVH